MRDYEPSCEPDKEWFQERNVPPGGARTRVKDYRQRIVDEKLLTTEASEPPQPPPRPPARKFFYKDGWFSFLVTADDIAKDGVIDTRSILKEGIMQLRVWSPPGTRYLCLTPAATDDATIEVCL